MKTQLSYEERAKKGLEPILQRLQKLTRDCRIDMHEPDEQGVSAVVRGNHLDNAMGDDPIRNCEELTVGITKDNRIPKTEWFNLADLIALARMAVINGEKH